MDSQSHVYTHYALLIGIDSYQKKPLKGCVRDVEETKKLLDSIPKPASVHTEILTASRVLGTNDSRPVEDATSLPTHHNVIERLKQIASQAKAGDFVYIHFSGHGTAFRPPLKSAPSSDFSNRSTGDLALNLLDADGQTRYLHGSELAYLLEDMVSRKLIVTLVLDCCFSGSVMRNDVSARFLEYDPAIDVAHDTISGPYPDHNMRPTHRHATLRPNWLIDPNGYTVLTACGPTEIAREIQVDQHVHGALSYFLNGAFDKIGGIGGKQQYIYQFLRARFLETRSHFQHNQTPMLYGNKALFFFGRANPWIGAAPIPVTGNCRTGYQLEAGQAHSICLGDEFSVCTFSSVNRSERNAASTGNSVVARVSTVGVFTSKLDVPQMIATSSEVLIAIPITRLALRKLHILVELRDAYADTWTEVVNKQRSLVTHNAGGKDQDRSCCLAVSMSVDGFYDIRDQSNQVLLRLPVTPSGPKEDAMQLLETLRHLAEYKLTRSLTNDTLNEQTNAFKQSFSVQIINAASTRIKPGCRESGLLCSECSHEDCMIRVEDNTTLHLEVENKNGHNLYLHVYTMSSSWQVENILSGDYVVVPPCSTNKSEEFRKGSDGMWKKKLLMTVPEEVKQKGETHCNDIIKIFLTSQPTSFLSMELPELGGLLERNKLTRTRGGCRGDSLEAWAALSFNIHTYVQQAQ